MRRFLPSFVMALAIGLAGSLTLSTTPALAHDHRDIGTYEFVVGFMSEPALQGQPNGIDLSVTDKATKQPVEGLEKTLKAAIAFGGGQPKELTLRTRFQQPGKYAADLIPTRPGSYIFTFSGTINGQPINEKFESGPGRFDDVQASMALHFPVADPSPAQLQQWLDQARQQAATANTLAMAGLAVAVLSLLLAGYLLLARRPAGQARAMAAQGSRAD